MAENYGQALTLLARDYEAERRALERRQRLNESRLARKERRSSILGTLGGLSLIALLNPATALGTALAAGLGSLAGRAIGGASVPKLAKAGAGKFLESQREAMNEAVRKARETYLTDMLTSSLASAVLAGTLGGEGKLLGEGGAFREFTGKAAGKVGSLIENLLEDVNRFI